MAKPVGAIWTLQWSNPYTNPPEGMARVIAEKLVKYGDPFYNHIPPEFEADKTPGYTAYWSAVMEPSKQLSEKALKSIRRKRLKRRIENKYPLFADQFLEDEIKNNSDYFEGKSDPEAQAVKDRILRKEWEFYEKFLEMVDEQVKVKS
jgi:hypothetical protein